MLVVETLHFISNLQLLDINTVENEIVKIKMSQLYILRKQSYKENCWRDIVSEPKVAEKHKVTVSHVGSTCKHLFYGTEWRASGGNDTSAHNSRKDLRGTATTAVTLRLYHYRNFYCK